MLEVHSILVHDHKAVGVRFKEFNRCVDVAIPQIRGLRKELIMGYPTQKLSSKEGLMLTEEEIKTGVLVEDVSEDKLYCKDVQYTLVSHYLARNKDAILEVVKRWYDKGKATWTYARANGSDGQYGGSFHSISDEFQLRLDNDEQPYLSIEMDFGSASIPYALSVLREMLEKANFPFMKVSELEGRLVIFYK